MPKNELNLEDILTDKAVEEDLMKIPLADHVFRFFLWVAFILTGVGLVQLLNLGVLKSDFYQKRAAVNASEIQITPAPRGIIFDRFGNPLLKNEPSFNAFLVPAGLPKSAAERLTVFGKISEILQIDQADLDKKIAERDWSLSDKVPLTDNLSHDELVALSSANIPGVKLEPTFLRLHEPALKFAHVLGYASLVSAEDLSQKGNLTADDTIGRSGLEAYYDDYLRGKNGEEVFLRDARGQIKDKAFSEVSQPGDALDTFIDRDLQEYFYDSLANALNNLGRQIGLGIAMNPQNGEVLALFNIPSFDTGNIGHYLDKENQPFFDRAVSGLYNPGSTIKPLVATAALTEGVIDTKKQIYSPGFLDVPNPYDSTNPSRFLDWRPQGWVDLYAALARSSNVYFYEVGGGFENQIGLGISRLRDWWHRFMLDEKTNIDLPGEESGFLPDPDWKEVHSGTPWLLGDTYNVSIGQGDLLITPVELLNYVSAIANGGKFYEPRIMKDIRNGKGEIMKSSQPVVLRDLTDTIGKVLPAVRAGMRDAVQKSYGTANMLADLPVKVAAKTGSAQTNNNAKVNALFVGYEPYDNPQIAVIILVENAREGSLNVVPVAKDVLLWYYENRLKK